MAIPPRPMGTLVDGGQMQGGMDENLPSVDVSIPQVEDFAGERKLSLKRTARL